MSYFCRPAWKSNREKRRFLSEFKSDVESISSFPLHTEDDSGDESKDELRRHIIFNINTLLMDVGLFFNKIMQSYHFRSIKGQNMMYELYSTKKTSERWTWNSALTLAESVYYVHIGHDCMDLDMHFPAASMEIRIIINKTAIHRVEFIQLHTAPFAHKLGFANVLTVYALLVFHGLWKMFDGNMRFDVLPENSIQRRMFDVIFSRLGYTHVQFWRTELNTTGMNRIVQYCAQAVWAWHQKKGHMLKVPFPIHLRELEQHILSLNDENAQISSACELLHSENKQLREELHAVLQGRRQSRNIGG